MTEVSGVSSATSTTSTKASSGASVDYESFLKLLVAELKKRGIYTNLNLHVNRTFKADDGVAGVRIASTPASNACSKSRLMSVRTFCART